MLKRTAMILKASQRSGGQQLARHLLNDKDNDHVEIHEIRGFVASGLQGAFNEAYAMSRGTRCQQYLFSVSLNPPESERVPVDVFEAAIRAIEKKLGLSDQPRAIIFHEKQGRRHAHVVWSRIDVNRMRAINLPHFKLKMRDISRQLFLEHGWKLPQGLMNSDARNPLNFSLAEWQQAQRMNVDPRVVKAIVQECWAASDSGAAFMSALKEHGYYLAQGDRRGHVVLDWRGNVFAVSRAIGITAKDLRAKLGEADQLPTVGEIEHDLSDKFSQKIKRFAQDIDAQSQKGLSALTVRKQGMVQRQRIARQQLKISQEERRKAEHLDRAQRLPSGIKGLWWKVTGKWSQIVNAIEQEFHASRERNRQEQQKLIEAQLAERRILQMEIRQEKERHALSREMLDREMAHYGTLSQADQDVAINNRTAATKVRVSRKRSRVQD